MECDFCKKTFSTKYLLSQHQKKTKYCLDIQGEQSIFECNFCHKHLSTKDRLIVHTNSCKEKTRHEYTEKELLVKKDFDERLKLAENIIQEKNEYISKLEAKLEKMEAKLESKLEKLESTVTTIALEAKTVSAKPVTTNNTTNHITVTTNTNNVLNLSKEHVNKVLKDNIDYNVVYAGQAGLATLVVEKMLTDSDGKLMYHCVDPSRQMFEFTGENGEKVRDLKAEKLIQSLLKGDVIRTGLEEAAKGWNTDDQQLNIERTTVFGPKVSEYADLNRNNTVFRSKVSSLTM
jgi:uncharacterized coiled-coil protein SlyX